LTALNETFFYKQYQKKEEFIPKRGQVVIDVGASVGDYALLCARLVGKKGKVLAFEPNHQLFELLEKNKLLNSFNNLLIFNLALSNRNGIIEMRRGLGFLDSLVFKGKIAFSYKVKTTKLDNVINKVKLKKIDLIKIDVEGAEELVLRGASHTIKTFKPKILLEVHSNALKKECLNFLKKFGYRVVFVEKPKEKVQILYLKSEP